MTAVDAPTAQQPTAAPAPTQGPAPAATYPDLVALRRPHADHSGLITAILPAVRRPHATPQPAPAVRRPAGYIGQHRARSTR